MLTHRNTRVVLPVLHAAALVGWLVGWWPAAVLPITLALHLALLCWASFSPRAGFFIKHQVHGDPHTLALTYDDGPLPLRTEALLDVLKQEGVKATFFCIGDRVRASPELAKRIVAEGHTIGVHTQRHVWWWGFLTRAAAYAEAGECVATIKEVTGTAPILFRPPYGVTSPATAWAIAMHRLTPVAWDLRTFDTVTRNEHQLMRRTLRKLPRASIVVMHDTSTLVVPLTKVIINAARSAGKELVRLKPTVLVRSVLFTLGFTGSVLLSAQVGKQLSANDPLVLRLLERSRAIKDLQASFTQEKHLRALAAPVISSGRMCFQLPDRLRWEVLVPQTSTAIVKAGEVRRSEGGQEKPVSTADQQVYLATCELIAGIVSGRSLSSSSMHVTYTRKPEGLVVDLSPTDARMAKRMKSVQLVFAEEDLRLKELRMEQVNGDRTITRFSNAVLNGTLPSDTFSL